MILRSRGNASWERGEIRKRGGLVKIYSFILVLVITTFFGHLSYSEDVKVPPQSIVRAVNELFDDIGRPLMVEDVREFAKYRVGEVVFVLAQKLNHEVFEKPDLEESPERAEVIKEIIKTLETIGAPEVNMWSPAANGPFSVSLVDMLNKLQVAIETQWNDKPYKLEYVDLVNQCILNILSKKDPVLAHRQVVALASQAGRAVTPAVIARDSLKPTLVLNKDKLDRIVNYMNENVIEQPDVIKYFENILQKSMVLGLSRRTKPTIVYLMGMPGTGKDTSAEAFVDGMFGKKGAHSRIESGVPLLFRLPVTRDKSDMWKILGSSTGYVGSSGKSKMTPFIRWLVKFSGGKYKIVEDHSNSKDKEDPYIIENPAWEPGLVLEGYYPPEMGVLFVNEFHNWSSEAKDIFLKQFLEKGYISLNNPGQGVSELYVPINIVIATNEGIGLVSTRELDGRIVGRPKTYQEAKEARDKANANKDLLKNEIMRTNGLDTAGTPADQRRGISEEVLNRIPPSGMILMNPISPEGLQRVSRIIIEPLQKSLKESTGLYGSLDIQFTDDVFRMIQEYHYNAESNARPIEDNIKLLVENTIFEAIRDGQIKGDNEGRGHKYIVGVQKNDDRTMHLTFTNAETNKVDFTTLIEATLSDRPVEPISQRELDDLLQLESRIRETYVGNDAAVRKLVDYIITSERTRNKKRESFDDHDPARVLFFAGLSSTGKTELGKALARSLNVGGLEDRFVVDFNLINNREDLKEMIYGTTDRNGNAVASPFMKYYDKFNGRIVIYLEEITNAHLDILTVLYDLFRESVLQGFSDKKPRSMSNVTIIGTGNVGAEWFNQIPTDIPDEERMMIYAEIYRRSIRDPNFLRESLKLKLPEPLVNRIQLDNTFFFEPHNFKSVRQLTQSKLNMYIDKLKPSEGAGGWYVTFETQADYLRTVQIIEESGFRIAEQGASIDGYINTNVVKAGLHVLLIKNKVRFGSQVVIKAPADTYERQFRGSITSNYMEPEDNSIKLEVLTEDGRTLTWSLPRNERKHFAETSDQDKIMTAYHEAGHSIVRQILMHDKYMPDLITTVPGVDNFGGKWLRYLGLASYDPKELVMKTRLAVLEEMAVLFGGEVAQTLASQSATHDAGKNNDIERAKELARLAILEWGLSEAWGRNHVSESEFASLSEPKRKLYEAEVDKMLAEARELARQTLLLNYDSHLVPLATRLAEQGTLFKSDLEEFYAANKSSEKLPNVGLFGQLTGRSINAWKASLAGLIYKSDQRDAQLLGHLPKPKKVAGTKESIDNLKRKALVGVNVPANSPIGGFKHPVAAPGGTCSSLFM